MAVEILEESSGSEISQRSACNPELLPRVEQTAVANPLEPVLVDDMRDIVRGNITSVPKFVRNLICYFEEGSRPGMSPSEVTQHLGSKATFVLNSLFHLPEVVAKEEATDSALGNSIGASTDGGEETDENNNNNMYPNASSALSTPTGGRSLQSRWYDILTGISVCTSAWKFAGAALVMHASSLIPVSRRHTCVALVALLCYQRVFPSAVALAGDAVLMWTAYEAHTQQYTLAACAQAAVAVSLRAYM